MIPMEPIGYVCARRTAVEDDYWGGTESSIVLDESFDAEALRGLEDFSHAEIVFHFHKIPEESVERGTRHPRNDPKWPRTGVFAMRSKNRPNRIGCTMVRVLRREGRTLYVAELDALDGTPVLDIKPVIKEFLPRGEVKQPWWCSELLAEYWAKGKE